MTIITNSAYGTVELKWITDVIVWYIEIKQIKESTASMAATPIENSIIILHLEN